MLQISDTEYGATMSTKNRTRAEQPVTSAFPN